eukprot:TRINITY_DN14303_c0_g1_i1.p1 TRINITY_DN14303_c0_g1~~TRINITY_DN14303_c0_g1_i1.p1  ORF type:complete len:295 (+),score=6.65 TRINITY_DN14303_c0_g1_i1:302-1186(+)
MILADLATTHFKKLAKYRKLLGRRSARSVWRKKYTVLAREPANSFQIGKVDIYERTGLFEDQFEQIFQRLLPMMSRPLQGTMASRSHPVLSLRKRLLLVLHWLRDYHKYRSLRDYYGVSISTISRNIYFIIPKLYLVLDEIKWPQEIAADSLLGSVDCTCHFRFRVHPRQADYYRADKHGFFITAQVTINLLGQLINVHLGLGHNNDKGMFRISGLDTFIEMNQCFLLADKGYSHHRLVTPDDDMPPAWNNWQKGVRSRVEAVIGMVKHYTCCALTFRQNPELPYSLEFKKTRI